MRGYRIDIVIGANTLHFIIHGKTKEKIRADLKRRYPNGVITLFMEYP